MPGTQKKMSLLRWIPNLPGVAELCQRPTWLQLKKRRTGAKAAGQRYEKQIQGVFGQIYGSCYLPGPWFRYRATPGPEGQWSYCQPDGLFFDISGRRIVIVEIKLRHTPAAFEQLYTLYLPVVTRAFGGEGAWVVCLTEVVRWYDPGIKFPVPIRLVPRIEDTRQGELTVHICNPKRSQFKAQHPELRL